MKLKKIFLSALCVTFLCSNFAHAIEENSNEIKLDEDSGSYTIFSKIKRNQINTMENYIDSKRNSSIDIDKFTRDDIEKQNNPSLSTILQQSAGVNVNTNSGSDGNISVIRIRGTDRVRTTIDGLRADRNTGTSPNSELQFINTDDLEFIEVIKGPQGNIFGTNASGGAVNMQTRRGRGPFKMELGSEIGGYGMYKERAAIMGEKGKLDYYLSGTYYKTSGGMRTSDLGRLNNDEFKIFHVVSNLGYKVLNEKAEIRNILRFSNAKKGIGYGYGDGWMIPNYNDPNNYATNIDISENLSFKHAVNDRYDYNVRFGIYHNRNNNYLLPDNFYPTMKDITYNDGTRLNFMTQHNFKLAKWNSLSVGYNMEKEYIRYDNFSDYGYGAMTQNINASTLQNEVYVNDVINIKDTLFIRGGVRYSHNDQYGDYITPNASAALVLPTFKLKGAKTKFRGSWGQSVNNPTLYQRYADIPTYNFYANPDLKSEKLQSWDVGIEQSFWNEKLKLEFGYFNSNYEDYISYVTNPITWSSSYENIQSAKIQGYEGKLTIEPNDYLKFILNYTHLNTEDESTGLNLPQAPENSFSAGLYLTPIKNRWDVYAGLVTTSSRRASGGSNPDNRVDGIADARLGTKIRLASYKGIHLYLKGDIYNLFNKANCYYREGNVYYYTPGVQARVGLFLEYNKDKQKELDELKYKKKETI